MVDIKAIHTLLDAKVVEKYGLKLKKSPFFVQTVSPKAQAIVGMVYDIQIVIGSWTGKRNLMSLSLVDFEVILGIDILKKFHLVPIPHLDGVMNMDEANPNLIKGDHPCGEDKKVKNKGPIISAILVQKGLKKR
ncbi:putative lysine-specific histone demethylase 1 -like protein 3-like [Capsicum annuum]|nr:putative lysine-specific histone demethylase 1 -like protein 3-like [Capsicum annuum]